MAHQRFEYPMPASAAVVFDAFHYHVWRSRWDSLVRNTRVVGGAPCPSVGAITENQGRGWLGGVAMRTQFVSYDRPRVAAARMLGVSFPFRRWAASMQHRAVGEHHSVLIYTYTLEAGPPAWRWLIEPVVEWVFIRQTHRRFARLQRFLQAHANDVAQWQRTQTTSHDGITPPPP